MSSIVNPSSSGGGGSPTGPAGGDLSGTYPNPTVAKINGNPLGLTTPTAGNLLVGSGAAWVTQALSGDATLAASGALTLATVNANVGSFGDATHVGAFTVNAKGLITAASNVLITGTTPGGTAGGDLSGTYPNPTVIAINGVAYNADPLVQYFLLAGRAGGQTGIGGTASGNNLVFRSNTSDDGNIILGNNVATDSAVVVHGTTTGISVDGTPFKTRMLIHGQSVAANLNLLLGKHQTTAVIAPTLGFSRSHGTEAAPAVVVDNDILARIIAYGYNGTDYSRGAQIHAEVDDPTPSTTSMGGAIVFSTTRVGTLTLLEQARIAETGDAIFSVNPADVAGARSFFSIEANNGVAITGAGPIVLGLTVGGSAAVGHAAWTLTGNNPTIFFVDASPRIQTNASTTKQIDALDGYRCDPEIMVGSGSTLTVVEYNILNEVTRFDRLAATGTLNVTTFNTVKSQPAINTGTTIGLRRGLYFAAPSGGGTTQTAIGLEVEDMTVTSRLAALRSAVTANANKRCIESTGSAASVHVGTLRLGDTTVATSQLEVVGDEDIIHDGAAVFLTMTTANANAASSAIIAPRRARGTIASPTAVSNNDKLWAVNVFGHDGSVYTNAAAIEVDANETWDGTHHAARLIFLTRASADVNQLERMRIGPTGNVGVGGTSLTALFNVGASDQFQVSSDGNVTAQGSAHLFGTAGTACKLTVGQGTTGTDTSEIVVRSGNSTTAAIPRITLQRNLTKVADIYTDGANTFLEYGGTAGRLFVTAGGVGGGVGSWICDENGNVAIQNNNPPFNFPFMVGGADANGAFSVDVNGVVKRYRTIATVSNGVPAEYATVDLTAQGAAIGATLLYAVPASGAGMYRISYVATVTRAATTSSTLGGTGLGFQIDWTDNDTNVAKLSPAGAAVAAGTNTSLATPTNQANTTAASISGCIIVNARPSTNINYRIGYTSSGATTMQYNLHIKIEAM